MIEIVKNAAMDLPDVRDFQYEDIRMGSMWSALPEEMLPDYFTPVLDQGPTMRCTLFSAAGAAMAMNGHEALSVGVTDYQKTTGLELLDEAIKMGFSEKDGWYIQSAIRLYVNKKYMTGYAALASMQEVKQAIVDKKKICTGSNSISWADTKDIAVIKSNSPGHAFFIDGYDKTGFIIRNSYGPNYNKNGYFTLKYEDFSALYTCYAMLDESDAPMLFTQYVKMKGWCNLDDFRPNEVSTRLFGATLISKATWVCLNDIFDVSERRAESPMTATAFQTIFSKTGKKIKVPQTDLLKRWEVVKLLKTYL